MVAGKISTLLRFHLQTQLKKKQMYHSNLSARPFQTWSFGLFAFYPISTNNKYKTNVRTCIKIYL